MSMIKHRVLSAPISFVTAPISFVILKRSAKSQDSRRNQLIGKAVLLAMQRGVFDESVLQYVLDSGLTHPDDRALFNLD